MAHQRMYVSRPFKHKNRMLVAGESVILPNPAVRLYTHLGYITDVDPRAKLKQGIITPDQAREELGLKPITPLSELEPSPEQPIDDQQAEPAPPPTEPIAPVVELEQPSIDPEPVKQESLAAPSKRRVKRRGKRKPK